MSDPTPHGGPAGDESYEAPASDADEGEDQDDERGTPFASGGGTNQPGARTDEPRDPDEPQRSE